MFGVPNGTEEILPDKALPRMAVATELGVVLLFADKNLATTPATCGDAIEVPLIVLTPKELLLVISHIDSWGNYINT